MHRVHDVYDVCGGCSSCMLPVRVCCCSCVCVCLCVQERRADKHIHLSRVRSALAHTRLGQYARYACGYIYVHVSALFSSEKYRAHSRPHAHATILRANTAASLDLNHTNFEYILHNTHLTHSHTTADAQIRRAVCVYAVRPISDQYNEFRAQARYASGRRRP